MSAASIRGDTSTAESYSCTVGIGVRVPVTPPCAPRALDPPSGEHPGCGPGAALNTEGTSGCGVRLLCSPPLSLPFLLAISIVTGRRIGPGPSLLRTQCAPLGVGFDSSVFRHAAGARGRATCLVSRSAPVRFRTAAPLFARWPLAGSGAGLYLLSRAFSASPGRDGVHSGLVQG